MSTFLAPSRSCFVQRGAAQLLRPPPTTARYQSSTALLLVLRPFSSFPAPPAPPAATFISPRRTLLPLVPRSSPQAQQSRRTNQAGRWWRADSPDEEIIILADYNHLPHDYTDEHGIPFGQKNLEAAEVRHLFGSSISAAEANTLLRILHGRRVAGTLDHPEYFHTTDQYGQKNIIVALTYLRGKIEVDEALNAGLRAKNELAQIKRQEDMDQLVGEQHDVDKKFREDLAKKMHEWKTKSRERQLRLQAAAAERGEKEGVDVKTLAQPQEEEIIVESEAELEEHLRLIQEKAEEDEAIEAYKPDPVYGTSMIDETRFKNKYRTQKRLQRRRLEKQARLESQGMSAENIGALMARDLDPKGQVALPEMPREASPQMQKWVEKGQDLKDLPNLSASQRLVPSTILAILSLIALFTAHSMYIPPKESERILPSIPFSVATVGALILVNTLVTAAWKLPPLWRAMNRYFLLVPGMPRAFSLFGALFSHQTVDHLAMNMVVLAMVGIPLADRIGRADFMTCYMAAGLLGNIASLYYWVSIQGFRVSSNGASAAVLAVFCAYFYLTKDEKFRLGAPEDMWNGVPGWLFLALMIGYQGLALTKWAQHTWDMANHLMGVGAGVGWGIYLKKKEEEKEKRKQEWKKLRRARLEEEGKLKREAVEAALVMLGKK